MTRRRPAASASAVRTIEPSVVAPRAPAMEKPARFFLNEVTAPQSRSLSHGGPIFHNTTPPIPASIAITNSTQPHHGNMLSALKLRPIENRYQRTATECPQTDSVPERGFLSGRIGGAVYDHGVWRQRHRANERTRVGAAILPGAGDNLKLELLPGAGTRNHVTTQINTLAGDRRDTLDCRDSPSRRRAAPLIAHPLRCRRQRQKQL